MNIGIDIDDTISETYEKLFPYAMKYTIEELRKDLKVNLEKEFEDPLYIESISEWNDKEIQNFWKKYFAEIIQKVNVKAFASDVINKLKDEGHTIYIITARSHLYNPDIKKITEKWLKDNEIKYDYLYMDIEDKSKIVKDNNIKIFIDDSIKNCVDVVENSDAKVCIMNSKLNEKYINDKVKRVYSWPEIKQYINKEAN